MFVIPGLIGIILTLTMMLFTAVAVVREREHGNLELIINTPVSTSQLMIGKVMPVHRHRTDPARIDRRELARYSLKCRYGAACLSSTWLRQRCSSQRICRSGLFVSTVVKTQFQAIQMTIFFLMPSILLSGFVFPFDGMPRVIQYLGEVLPTTHFIRLTRGIMLRDAALIDMAGEMVALGIFTLVAMTAAVLRFTKRLD